MSNSQMPKMEVSKSNGSFCNFYTNLPQTFFLLEMRKTNAHIWNEHIFNTRNRNFQLKEIIL